MEIKYALILAAGKGQRMGEIGQKLPKILWPIFEKSLLELQLEKVLELGAKEVYFNVYNYKEVYQDFYVRNKINERMTLLEENEVLDIGGAVHNFKKKIGDNILLLANGDQFLTIDKAHISAGLKLLEESDVVLFSYPVKKRDGYNKLNIKNGKLTGITKNSEILEDKFETYTGYALINLKKIQYQEGLTTFFESVANWKRYNVTTYSLGEIDYWDFGTITRYYENILKILNVYDEKNNKFIDFLQRHKAIKESKINNGEYVESNAKSNDGKNKLINIYPNFEIINSQEKLIWHQKFSDHPMPVSLHE